MPDLNELAPAHQELIRSLGISDEIANERGYRTVSDTEELKREGYWEYQASLIPGLLVPMYGADGVISSQFRPDNPRELNGKPNTYEMPAGSRNLLDIHPRFRDELGDPTKPLFITEGVHKADVLASLGFPCLALSGVWNWRGTNAQGGSTALSDWHDVALNEREVFIVFDSDVRSNSLVLGAMRELALYLKGKGASVHTAAPPAGEGGEDVGIDDYLLNGDLEKKWASLWTDYSIDGDATEPAQAEEPEPESTELPFDILWKLYSADEPESLTAEEQRRWDVYEKAEEKQRAERELLGLVDLAELMREGIAEPEMLVGDLLVRGEHHLMYGTKESGKTWLALWSAVLVMAKNHEKVIWVDKEMGRRNIARCFITLNVPEGLIDDYFTYCEFPTLDCSAKSVTLWRALLEAEKPALVVVDAQTEVLADANLKENIGTDIETWMQAYITPARRVGVATLMIDRTGHSDTDRASQGAAAKVELSVVKREAFSRENVGTVEVTETKNTLSAAIPKKQYFILGGGEDGFTIEQTSEAPQTSESTRAAGKQTSEAPQTSESTRAAGKQTSEAPQTSESTRAAGKQTSEAPQTSESTRAAGKQTSEAPQTSESTRAAGKQTSEAPQTSESTRAAGKQTSEAPQTSESTRAAGKQTSEAPQTSESTRAAGKQTSEAPQTSESTRAAGKQTSEAPQTSESTRAAGKQTSEAPQTSESTRAAGKQTSEAPQTSESTRAAGKQTSEAPQTSESTRAAGKQTSEAPQTSESTRAAGKQTSEAPQTSESTRAAGKQTSEAPQTSESTSAAGELFFETRVAVLKRVEEAGERGLTVTELRRMIGHERRLLEKVLDSLVKDEDASVEARVGSRANSLRYYSTPRPVSE